MNLTALRTLTLPRALFFFVRPSTTFHTDRMTLLELTNHFLFNIISCRLKDRTILDSLWNSFFSILELVLVGGSITNRTILFSLTCRLNSSSSFWPVALSWVSFVTDWTFRLLSFRNECRIDRLLSESFPGDSSRMFEECIKGWPSRLF